MQTIKRELKLEATPSTIARALNRNGYKWCQVARKSPLTPKQLQVRKVWVTRAPPGGPRACT